MLALLSPESPAPYLGFRLLWSVGNAPSVIDKLTSAMGWQSPVVFVLRLYCSGQQDAHESVYLQASETAAQEIYSIFMLPGCIFLFLSPTLSPPAASRRGLVRCNNFF